MKKLKKILNNKLYVLTFIMSTLIIGFLYKINNVTPFGTQSLLCVDFYHQYGPMLAELYDKVHHLGNFIYSFNMAMGLPFFRNFLNYLSSPFNIIMLFFPRNLLITSYSFIIGFKAVVASVTCVYFLSKKFDTKSLLLMPLGILYAFSAYFSAYYWNIMWLDGMVFLPLITLGIEYIVDKKKWKTYTISLFIMLIANYFIGYMICIYSVVYFILYNILKTSFKIKNLKHSLFEFVKKCWIFAFSSLLAGALGAFLLLPMASSMASISATGGDIPISQYYDFEVEDYIKSHLSGVKTTVFASDEITPPNVSCGILVVGLLLLFIFNYNIKIKTKIIYLLLLGFFILAFFDPALDYILHAFHVPNDLPYRYSFLYSFVLIIISAYSLLNIKNLKFPIVALSYLILMLLLVYISQDEWPGSSTNMIYINMILLTLYFVLYSGHHYVKSLDSLFYFAAAIIASVDVIVSINYNWDITQVLKVFYQDYEPTKELLNYVQDYDDELFYRIENTTMMTLNDGSWYDYHGTTTFSSMAYESMAILQRNLGIPGNGINSYFYVQSTPIYDLMFDVKYFIGWSNDKKRYTEIKTIDETANKFDYNVGLIFGVNKDIKNWAYSSSNPFVNQNDFIEKATGVKDVLKKSKLIDTDEVYQDEKVTILKYRYENTFDNMYFYTNDYGIDYFIIGETLYFNNDSYLESTSYSEELSYSYSDNYDEKRVINIASQDDEIVIYIAYNSFYYDAAKVYDIDQEKFESAYKILKSQKFDMTSFKESEIIGNISLKEDKTIYTSIPYDNGWQVFIDGKKVKTKALGNALLTFDCEKGTHKITIRYVIPHFALGLSITSLSIIFLLIKHFYKKRIINFFKRLKTKELKN